MAGWYIPKRPGCEQEGPGKNNGVSGANPAQSGPIIPAALEAEVARLNRGRGDDAEQGNESQGNYGTNGEADWDREDEKILKEAAEAHQRREAARKAEEEKKAEEEYRLWRVDFGFEEPTEEDIALGRTKRKRWNKSELENANSPTSAGQPNLGLA